MSNADFHIYGANVALHVSLLALTAWAAVKCFHNPHARSLTAALGLMAVAVIPWISASQVSSENTTMLVRPIEIPALTPTPVAVSETIITESETEILPSPETFGKLTLPDPWLLAFGIWTLGTVAMLARQLWIAISLARRTKAFRDSTGEEQQMISLPYRVKIAAPGVSPFVTGVFRPLLVIPEDLLAANRHRELVWALNHEAGHLQGRDLQWLALFQVIRAMFWWNPFVHHLVRLWSESREQICDSLALGSDGDRKSYGEFLVSLGARRPSGMVMTMAAHGTVARLKRRIGFLLEAKTWPPCGRRFVMGGVAFAAVLGAGMSFVGCQTATVQMASSGASLSTMVWATNEPNRESWSENFEVPMIRISQTIIFTTKPVVTNGQVLSEKEFDALWEKLVNAQVNKLHGLIGPTSNNQKQVAMEILVEDPAAKGIGQYKQGSYVMTPALDDTAFRFVGLRAAFTITGAGKYVKLKCRAAYSGYPGLDWDSLKGFSTYVPPADPAVLKNVRPMLGESQARLSSGEVSCVTFGEVEPGRFATLFYQAEALRSFGTPAPDFSATPPVGLIAKGWILTSNDAAVRPDRPEGPFRAPPEYSKSEADALKQSAKGEVVELPDTTTQTGASSVLWNQLPQVQIAARHQFFKEPDDADLLLGISMPNPGGKNPNKNYMTQLALGKFYAFRIPADGSGKPCILFLTMERKP